MNCILISGRLGQNPELKTGANGTEYTTISVAVDRRKEKDKERVTDWFYCTAFGKMAVFVTTYFHKGDGIELRGRMENSPFEDKEGHKRDSWKIMIEHAEFPKGKNTQAEEKSPANQTIEGFTPVSEDDIPF